MPGAMPQNHARELRERKPMTRRGKSLLALSGAVIVAAVVVIIALGGTKTAPGCINTNLAGAMGAEPLKECGHDARQTCATVKEHQHQFGTVGVLNIEKACARGQLAVG